MSDPDRAVRDALFTRALARAKEARVEESQGRYHEAYALRRLAHLDLCEVTRLRQNRRAPRVQEATP